MVKYKYHAVTGEALSIEMQPYQSQYNIVTEHQHKATVARNPIHLSHHLNITLKTRWQGTNISLHAKSFNLIRLAGFRNGFSYVSEVSCTSLGPPLASPAEESFKFKFPS